MAAFQPWKLFTDITVNEGLPTITRSDSVESSAGPIAEPPETVTEQAASERVVTAEGTFISHEHSTKGGVRIVSLADGSRVLRLVELDTDNGPDLKVWLAAAPVLEGTDRWFVFDDDDYLDLGPLKGNKGSQNYLIPAGADISGLTSVTIWCDSFSVSFGAAELIPTKSEDAASDSTPEVAYPNNDQGRFLADLLTEPLPENEATRRIEEAGFAWRLGMVDGKSFLVTEDFRPERLTFTIADGLVVDAVWG